MNIRLSRIAGILIIALVYGGCTGLTPRVAPVVTVSAYFNTPAIDFVVSVQDTQSASDTIRYSLYASNGTLSAGGTETVAADGTVSVSVPDVADGFYELYVYLVGDVTGILTPAASLPLELYVDTEAPNDPALDTNEGAYVLPIYVTLEDAETGVTTGSTTGTTTETVRYTDDGSTPSATSTIMPSPFIIGAPTTLTLTQFDAAGNASNAVSYTFTTTTATTISIDNTGPVGPTTAAVSLTSTASGTIATYQWSVESGTGTTTLGTPTAADTTFSGPVGVAGTYVVRVTGTDAGGVTASDEITIYWDDLAPTVAVGNDIGPTASVESASASIIETSIASIAWTSATPGIVFGNSAAPTTTIDASAVADGSHTITCTVTDTAGNVGSDSLLFDWDASAPTVSITTADPVTWKNTITPLTATASDTNALTYQWEVVSGITGVTFSAATALSTDFTGPANIEDQYVVRFTATDSAGNSASDEITVQWDARAPVISAGPDLSVADGQYYAIAALIEEAGSGIASITWAETPDDPTATLLNASSITSSVSIGTAANSVTLSLDVTDAAGNAATQDTMVFSRP